MANTKDYSMREMIIDQCLGTGREFTREELQEAVNKGLLSRDMLPIKSKVTILQDLPHLTGEERLQQVLAARDNVTVRTNLTITGLLTEGGEFRGVSVKDRTTGEEERIGCDGLFVAIGLIPENKPFEDLAALNDWGYFDSGEDCLTRTPGIYVAGDCRSKRVRQLTTAVADGATAALAACNYINQLSTTR